MTPSRYTPARQRAARRRPARRGAALPAALAALALLGALALAGTGAARAERRAARSLAAAVTARAAADGALAASLAAWPADRNLALLPGAADAGSPPEVPGTVVRATRLSRRAFLLDASATARSGLAGPEGLAARRLWLLVRLRRLAPAVAAAVTAAGVVAVGDGAAISALDAAPPGWRDCDPPPAAPPGAVPALAVDDLAGVSVARDASVVGEVRAVPAAGRGGTYADFGEGGWASLAARAAIALDGAAVAAPTPRVRDGVCAIDGGSWGEPRRGDGAVGPCERASPVVVARGPSLALRGPARSQGVLLVAGDLLVEGEVEHAGLVVVRGAVRGAAGALRVRGALLVANDDGRGASTFGRGSEIAYSSCAVARALLAVSPPTPAGRWSWMEVTR